MWLGGSETVIDSKVQFQLVSWCPILLKEREKEAEDREEVEEEGERGGR